jgi:uncharacterized RDD family membrane protein YckC
MALIGSRSLKAPVDRRIAAFFIDSALAFAIGLLGVLVGFFPYYLMGGAFGTLLFLVFSLAGVIVSCAFILFRDSLFSGYGVGKRFLGLRVVKSDGSKCDVVSSALRNVTYLIPLVCVLEVLMGVLDREGLRLGDRIAKTQVVE